MKKLFCGLTALFTVLILSLAASSASVPYSVVVRDGKASFYQNNTLTASYGMQDRNLTLLTDAANDLMICFRDKTGSFVGVTLGQQQSVDLFGPLDSLTLSSSLDRNVSLGASCSVGRLTVNAPVQVGIFSAVDQLVVNESARVVAGNGSVIRSRSMIDSDASLVANSGSSVSGGSVSGSTDTVSSNGFTFRTTAIEADDGERLRDLEDELEDNILAYRNNKRVYGTFEWADSSNVTVRRSGSHRFRFTEESGLGSGTGTIRVTVYGDDDIELDISSFTVDEDDNKLSDYDDELEDNVVAYDDDGDEISGRVRWENKSQRVRKTGWYDFIFTPKSSKYSAIRDEIKIIVDTDGSGDDDDDYDDDYYLKIEDIEISSSRSLGSLLDDLKDSVRAYRSSDDKRLPGKVKWLDSTSTRVRRSGDYEFRFTPNDKDYDPIEDYIYIDVDD